MQRDGDDVALVDWKKITWKRLVHVVSYDGDAWGSIAALEHARRCRADVPGADEHVACPNEPKDFASYACTD